MKSIFPMHVVTWSLLCCLAIGACKTESERNVAELRDLVIQLQSDTDKTLLKTLMPDAKEYKYLFNSTDAIMKVSAYSNKMWSNIDEVPATTLQPEAEKVQLNILSVTKEALEKGDTHGLPEECLNMTPYLNDGTTLYAMQYLHPDGTEHKLRSVFFKVGERWIIIPRVYRAFD